MPEPNGPRSASNYHGFLVRLWRVSADAPWQIVAKDVQTGEEFCFPDEEGLFTFLRDQITAAPARRLARGR